MQSRNDIAGFPALFSAARPPMRFKPSTKKGWLVLAALTVPSGLMFCVLTLTQ